MIIYRTAAACGLVLDMFEHCGVHLADVPIGGGTLAQLGVVFGIAFVLTEGRESAIEFGGWAFGAVREFLKAVQDLFRSGRP